MQQPAASPQQQQRAQPRQLHSPSESQKGPCHHSRYEQEQRSQRTSALGQPPQATAMIRSYKRFNEFLDGKKAREESRKGKRLSGYKLQRQLGQGAFAKVVQGRHSMTGDDVAIKRILKPYSNDAARTIMNEIYLMARLNHPNLVFLYQVVDTPAETALVLELGKLGTLNEHLERGIDGPLVTNILRQVMDGVRHMHTLGIAHRDIKADNVFMATPTRPLLGDFGFATDFHESPISEVYCGSPMYCSPELLNQRPYRPDLADVWALGILLFFINLRAFPVEPTNVQAWSQANIDAQCERIQDPLHRSWVHKLLQMDPLVRAIPEVPRCCPEVAGKDVTTAETELLAAMSRLEVGRDVATEQPDVYSNKQAVLRLYRRRRAVAVPNPFAEEVEGVRGGDKAVCEGVTGSGNSPDVAGTQGQPIDEQQGDGAVPVHMATKSTLCTLI